MFHQPSFAAWGMDVGDVYPAPTISALIESGTCDQRRVWEASSSLWKRSVSFEPSFTAAVDCARIAASGTDDEDAATPSDSAGESDGAALATAVR